MIFFVVIILKDGKSVSLDPLRPTPLPAGLPPAGAHSSRTLCTLLVQSQSSVDATMSIRDVAASCWCVHACIVNLVSIVWKSVLRM